MVEGLRNGVGRPLHREVGRVACVLWTSLASVFGCRGLDEVYEDAANHRLAGQPGGARGVHRTTSAVRPARLAAVVRAGPSVAPLSCGQDRGRATAPCAGCCDRAGGGRARGGSSYRSHRRRCRSERADAAARSAQRAGGRADRGRGAGRRAAEQLPFRDECFDAISFSYLLRYVDEPAVVILEMSRCLRPGGTMASLEFFVPPAAGWRAAWRVYVSAALPLAGWTAGGSAWWRVGRFLSESIPAHYRRYPLDWHVRALTAAESLATTLYGPRRSRHPDHVQG
jgi:SAM-dependent methyltransferase